MLRRLVLPFVVLGLVGCRGEPEVRTAQPRPSPVPLERSSVAMSLSAARDVAARVDYRTPRQCPMHCDGVGSAVRLRLEEERDYRFVLVSKKTGPVDEFRLSTTNRDTTLIFVERAEIGMTFPLRGEDALKVCARSEGPIHECEWTCGFDPAKGLVTMVAGQLSAELAVFCY